MAKRIPAFSRIAAGLFCLVGLLASPARSEDFITIGTGSVSGLYYPMGTAICRLLNQDRRRHGIRCSAEASEGSLANLEALAEGRVDFAIVQSDWQARAFRGNALVRDGAAFTDLRAVFSLYGEVFTVIARSDAGIRSFSDLQGKRINIGPKGSGQNATMQEVMAALGWGRDRFAEIHELAPDSQSEALCRGEIDAMIFVAGHPSATVEAATTACDSVLVEINEPAILRLVANSGQYELTEIPGGLYRGNERAIPSFGVSATLVTTEAQRAKIVHEVVRAVFSELDDLRKAHPAFAVLSKESMVKDYQTAPLHPAARSFYRFSDLLEPSSR